MLAEFLEQVKNQPDTVTFTQTMEVISAHYDFQPTGFTCGEQRNEAGTNEGSCKILAFAQANQLTPQQTLHLFGDYYRVDVLQHPDGQDHGNIRNFIAAGWSGVSFDQAALQARP